MTSPGPSVLHIITSSSWGGLEQYVVQLVTQMHSAGMKIAVVCLPGTRIHDELLAEGIPVFEAQKHSHFNIPDVRMVRNRVHRGGFDIVHSHTRKDVWLGSIALMGDREHRHINSVYMVVSPKTDLLHRVVYGRVDRIVSSSLHSNRKIESHYPISKERIELVRYGRDLGRYSRENCIRIKIREGLGIDDDELVFGIVGRIDVQKGVREFAESYRFLAPEIAKRVRYAIIGEPTIERYAPDGTPVFEEQGAKLDTWLNEYIMQPELQGRILRLPFQKDIVPFYNALDGLVLASYNEMYSLSVIEAMAMSLPVIGTNSEGTPEQVQHGVTGFLVRPHSAEDIARAVEEYVRNPVLLEEHGTRGRAWVEEQHAMDKTLSRFRALYGEVVKA